MALLVVSVLTYLFSVIIQELMSFVNGLYTNFFYSSMAFERVYGSALNVNINGIYGAVYKFAILILIMFFIKKMIETYLMWSSGDPDTSPFTILVNFLKALIVMIFFGYLYKLFVTVMYELYKQIMQNGLGTELEIVGNSIADASLMTMIGCVITTIALVQLLLLYIQNLTRGLQILILRLGIPFAAIGLLNSDGGVFKGYIKKLLQNAFTVIIQLILIQLAFTTISNSHFILGLVFASTATRVPSMLNEFLISSGSSTERGAASAFSSITSTIHHATGALKR